MGNMMTRVAAVVVVLAGLALTGCGDDSNNGDEAGRAGEALEQFLERTATGQHGQNYDVLHPAHQDLFDRDHYIDCADEMNTASVNLDGFTVTNETEEQVTLPGTDVEVDAVAVTFEAELGTPAGTQSISDTARVIDVDGEWRFAANEAETFAAGECP